MLSGQAIQHKQLSGDIIIEPFNPNNVQPNSYDITLGNWVVRFIENDEEIRLDEFDWRGLYAAPEFCSTIMLSAGERVLCHTNEFFGSLKGSVPCLATRSTIARLGLDICGSAGFGDIGYINRWTLELQNNNPNTLHLPVGIRIGQVYFNELSGSHSKYKGKYNLNEYNSYDFKYLEKQWNPHSMIPHKI